MNLNVNLELPSSIKNLNEEETKKLKINALECLVNKLENNENSKIEKGSTSGRFSQ